MFGNGRELDFIHLLFNLEEDFKLEPGDEYGTIRAYGYGKIPKALGDWGAKRSELKSGKIAREEYEEWKDAYST